LGGDADGACPNAAEAMRLAVKAATSMRVMATSCGNG
jgi:hypothetical protein